MLSHALHATFAAPADQRVADRRVLKLEASAATPGGIGAIQVHNLSRTGMLVECEALLEVGSTLEVELPGGTLERARVVWADETLFGCQFEQRISQAQLSAALLRSTPQASPSSSPSRASEEHAAQAYPEISADMLLPLPSRLRQIAGWAVVAWAVPIAAVALIVI